MTDEERRELLRLKENEEAEWAMKECIRQYREAFMPFSMSIRGYYESLINVGFSQEQAIYLTANKAVKG